jgi:DUF1365 family protein
MTALSALYVGPVSHRRLRPARHKLRYRLFMALLDFGDVERTHRSQRLFSIDRFNLFSIRQADYGPPGDGDLFERMVAFCRARKLRWDGSGLRLMTMPRILGFAFNPISLFFCHDRDGRIVSVVYEVHNTFGEKHLYGLDVADDAADVIEQGCEKAFHVSPFLDIRMYYDF